MVEVKLGFWTMMGGLGAGVGSSRVEEDSD